MNKTRRFALTAGLLVTSVALAQNVQRVLSLVVNGQIISAKAIVVKGETFVSLSALGALGVKSSVSGSTLTLTSAPAPGTPAGGANQRPATEGCLNETLFNGIWRVKVLSVEAVTRDGTGSAPGWGVTVELRNGTQKDISPKVSFDLFGNGIYLYAADGTATGNVSGDGVYYTFDKAVPPGGALRGQMRFYAPGTPDTWPTFNTAKPSKFILSVLNTTLAKNEGLAYSTSTPSFRVDLTCRK